MCVYQGFRPYWRNEIAEYDYGKFVHVLDPEGNILELWEPAAADAADDKV